MSIEEFRAFRAVTDGGAWARDAEPPVRLVLSGPGEAPMLPAGTELYDAASRAGAAIVLADATPGWHHVLVPDRLPGGGGVRWRWWTVEGHLPEPAHLSPGEADLMLADDPFEALARQEALRRADAVRAAADFVERQLSDAEQEVVALVVCEGLTDSEVAAIGPYATSHQKAIDLGWTATQAKIR